MDGVETVLQDEFEGSLHPLRRRDALDFIVDPFRSQEFVDLAAGLDGACLVVCFNSILVRDAAGMKQSGSDPSGF